MKNYFLFLEMNFDSDFFTKYYGGKDVSPGIYAIPEDSINPSIDDEDEVFNKPNPDFDDTRVEQQNQNKEKIDDQLSSMPLSPMLQLSPEQQQQYDKEIEPIKKIFLLQKLNTLAYTLKNNFSIDNDLELILKYASNLSYKSIQVLAINIINQLKQTAADEEMQGGNTQFNGSI